jgi:CubicO group peptidase (beta-lactamase class C family)
MKSRRIHNIIQQVFWSGITASFCLGFLGSLPAKAEAQPPQVPMPYETFFDQFLSAQMAADAIVGASVAVVKDGELAFAKGYGYADLEKGRAVEADKTLFFIGSDGKLFTWTAVMQLAEQGKLDLHADINAYLDFTIPAPFGEPITLHHLMTHTAGFEDDLNSQFIQGVRDYRPLHTHLKDHLPRQIYAPGTISAYSNYGTALAGYIVERVSGMPFEEYVNEKLLSPLQMQHTVVGNAQPQPLAADFSRGYKFQQGQYTSVDFEWVAAVPTAPLRTTVTDLSRFVLAHLNDGCIEGSCILQAETLQQMHASQFTHPGQVSGMTYGFLDTRLNHQRILWHMGESPRFTTLVVLIPEHQMGLIVTYNTPPVDDKAVLTAFMDTYFPVQADAALAAPQPGWEARTLPYIGTYLPARSPQTTAQVGIRLFQSADVEAAEHGLDFLGWHFQEVSPGVFQEIAGDRLLTFHQDEEGRRWAFVGPLAYFQVPWYQTPAFLLLILGFVLTLFISCWIGWLVQLINHRRNDVPVPSRAAYLLAGTFGAALVVLLLGYAQVLLGYADTYVYAYSSVLLLTIISWLMVPWTMMVLVATFRAWRSGTWALGWKIHYTLVAAASCASLWLLWSLNLLGGRI